MSTVEADVAVVGAGGAGSTVLLALERAWRERSGEPAHLARPPGAAPPAEPPRVVIVDPVLRTARDRTWSFWHEGPHDLDGLAHAVWQLAEIRTADGARHRLDLDPFRYVMLRSDDVYAQAHQAARALGARWITAPVADVREDRDGISFAAGDQEVRVRWLLDSRPTPPARAATVRWVQHFLGWTVKLSRPVLDPHVPVLMDLDVEQPAGEVAFGYVLPTDRDRALVEFTVLSPRGSAPWPRERYEAGLRTLVRDRWGIGPADLVVEGTESGGIPLTDAGFARRSGRRVVRIGTAGGAVRGSTGYAFAAMYRQARQIAAALLDGRAPVPGRGYPRRHRLLDGVMLTALDRGLVDGPAFFGDLWTAHAPASVLRFLDGTSSPAEELAVMAAAPRGAMTRAALAWTARSCGRIVTAREHPVAERH